MSVLRACYDPKCTAPAVREVQVPGPRVPERRWFCDGHALAAERAPVEERPVVVVPLDTPARIPARTMVLAALAGGPASAVEVRGRLTRPLDPRQVGTVLRQLVQSGEAVEHRGRFALARHAERLAVSRPAVPSRGVPMSPPTSKSWTPSPSSVAGRVLARVGSHPWSDSRQIAAGLTGATKGGVTGALATLTKRGLVARVGSPTTLAGGGYRYALPGTPEPVADTDTDADVDYDKAPAGPIPGDAVLPASTGPEPISNGDADTDADTDPLTDSELHELAIGEIPDAPDRNGAECPEHALRSAIVAAVDHPEAATWDDARLLAALAVVTQDAETARTALSDELTELLGAYGAGGAAPVLDLVESALVELRRLRKRFADEHGDRAAGEALRAIGGTVRELERLRSQESPSVWSRRVVVREVGGGHGSRRVGATIELEDRPLFIALDEAAARLLAPHLFRDVLLTVSLLEEPVPDFIPGDPERDISF